MIAIFIILYSVAIWLFFSKLKIKPRQTNIEASTTFGVLAIGAIAFLRWHQRIRVPSFYNILH
ncbi:MAG: hypothetical protein OSA98_11100 [Rubripirellula sp.]|nr:hypothetical protein [Rubripirellula sp.]